MKKSIYILLLILGCFTNIYPDNQHKQHIHEAIAVEAYLLLETKYIQAGGSYDALNQFFAGFPNIYSSVRAEDDDDTVYNHLFIPSLTHFWDADQGEDHTYPMGGHSNVKNNWTKARVFLFEHTNYGHKWAAYEGTTLYFYRTYKSLLEFYQTGSCIRYDQYGENPTNVNYDLDKARNEVSFDMLGRIAHLLADMSVPAHSHLDPHTPLNPDSYEEWMGENAETYFIDDNINKYGYSPGDDGFMPYITCFDDYEAMFYLFYTMNQISQHFKSNDVAGNNDLPLATNELLQQKYAAWGSPPTSVNVNDIADKTFDFCVGATASLFYWFGIRTGILQTEINTLEYDYEINNPTFTIKSTNSIILKPGFKFTATSPNGELKASIIDCGSQPEQIP